MVEALDDVHHDARAVHGFLPAGVMHEQPVIRCIWGGVCGVNVGGVSFY